MKKQLKAGLAVGALVSASTILSLTSAAPAHAGGCVAGMCGGVTNASYSVLPIQVTDNWNGSSSSVSATLQPGSSRGGWWSGIDVDGFKVPQHCYARVSGFSGQGTVTRNPGWHKVSTNEQVTVNVQCN